MIDIKSATLDMCEELAKVKRQVWETTYRGIYPDEKLDNYNFDEQKQKFERIIANKNVQLFVATDGNDIVGYMCAGLSPRPFNKNRYEIILLYVLKDYQGQGVGTRLFNLGKSIIKDFDNKFVVSCNKYNLPAQEFYKKMGGRIISEEDDMADKSIPQIKFLYEI